MATKNYYVILGIDEKETPSGIRGAFRELVKQHHPDRVGPAGRERFQEIMEAYEHLSDPELRRRYNDRLRADLRPPAARRRKAEPLVPEPASVFADPERVWPSPEQLFDRISRNFIGRSVPKGERPEALNLEVVLSPEEAVFGGVAPIRVPVIRKCFQCDSSGYNGSFPCQYCRQRGFIAEARTIRVRIPPMVRDGSILELAADSVGIRNLFLRLHIRIL